MSAVAASNVAFAPDGPLGRIVEELAADLFFTACGALFLAYAIVRVAMYFTEGKR